MVFLFKTELSKKKPFSVALKEIYGIGKSQSDIIAKKLGVSINYKVADFSNDQIARLTSIIEKSQLIFDTELKRYHRLVLKKKILIKSYKGLRRIRGLPIRGQRTHTNAKTARHLFSRSK